MKRRQSLFPRKPASGLLAIELEELVATETGCGVDDEALAATGVEEVLYPLVSGPFALGFFPTFLKKKNK